jgi:Anti-sigma-K factor rskA
MSVHISDELPRLLTGDANREAVMAAAEHLRTCPDCQQDLVSAVVAHAALTSAHRFAPEVVSGDTDDAPERTEVDAEVTPLPDMSSVFAQARDEAAGPAAAGAPVRHRRRLIAVAAAAAVIVGGGSTIAALELGSSDSTARSVALEPFLQGKADGAHAKVTMDDGKLRVDATTLPKLDSKHVYELWVTDSHRTNMSPVGTFSNGKAELTADHKVLSQYNDFEVSIQKINEIRTYSGISVVRGEYG